MSTRAEIRQRFRDENPEINSRVLSDTILNSWMLQANKEVCTKTRCLMSNVPETFTTTANLQYYDLESRITNFLDIDEMPGMGVAYNDKYLEKASPSEMNHIRRSWVGLTAGTPKRWWLRGKYLWFDRKPDAAEDVDLDVIYLPNDLDADGEEPFNEIGYLQVYDESISKYIQWRAKYKVGKHDEGAIAKKDYEEYLTWMKGSVHKMKSAPIQLRPAHYHPNV